MNFWVKITFFIIYIASSKVVSLYLKRQKALTSSTTIYYERGQALLCTT